MNRLVIIFFTVALSGCAGETPFQALQGIMGYIPPPEETTVTEELVLEFERCEKIDPDRNCAQIAYDMVRIVKGLEPRKVPEGVVIILEGDVKMDDPSPASDHPPGFKEN